MNFFAEKILTHKLLKNLWFPKETGWGEGGWAGVWGGNAVKLDCGHRCTTVNVIKFTELKKKPSPAGVPCWPGG